MTHPLRTWISRLWLHRCRHRPFAVASLFDRRIFHRERHCFGQVLLLCRLPSHGTALSRFVSATFDHEASTTIAVGALVGNEASSTTVVVGSCVCLGKEPTTTVAVGARVGEEPAVAIGLLSRCSSLLHRQRHRPRDVLRLDRAAAHRLGTLAPGLVIVARLGSVVLAVRRGCAVRTCPIDEQVLARGVASEPLRRLRGGELFAQRVDLPRHLGDLDVVLQLLVRERLGGVLLPHQLVAPPMLLDVLDLVEHLELERGWEMLHGLGVELACTRNHHAAQRRVARAADVAAPLRALPSLGRRTLHKVPQRQPIFLKILRTVVQPRPAVAAAAARLPSLVVLLIFLLLPLLCLCRESRILVVASGTAARRRFRLSAVHLLILLSKLVAHVKPVGVARVLAVVHGFIRLIIRSGARRRLIADQTME